MISPESRFALLEPLPKDSTALAYSVFSRDSSFFCELIVSLRLSSGVLTRVASLDKPENSAFILFSTAVAFR